MEKIFKTRRPTQYNVNKQIKFIFILFSKRNTRQINTIKNDVFCEYVLVCFFMFYFLHLFSYLVTCLFLTFVEHFTDVTIYYCLSNRTTLRFDFLHSFMVCAQTSAFFIHRILEFQDSQLRMRINTKPNGKQK